MDGDEEGMAKPLLTVVAGGADTGKSLIAEALVTYRGQVMIARDHVRALLRHPADEWTITLATFGMARELLRAGLDVCTVGWNLEPGDRAGWLAVARETGAECRWVQVEMAGQ
jgi:predicted kinase